MSDPTGGAAGQIANEMIKEVQEAMKQAEQVAQAQQNPNVAFDQVMNTQQVGQIQEIRPGNDAANVLRTAADTQRVDGTPEVPAIGQAMNTRRLSNGLQRVLEDVMQGQNKLEEIISLSISGRSFSTSELLALQAGVYRFTQELELTSKVIEKGTSSIKQTLNTQV